MTTSDTSSTSQTTTPSTGGQGAAPESAGATTPAPSASTMPEPLPSGHIEVQHVLIGYAGSVPQKNITRTQAEAATLAAEILARAKKGEDFGSLVQKYTDDQ